MISPLPSTSREHASQGNSLSLDVLERSKKGSPMTYQKLSLLQVNQHRNHKYGNLLENLPFLGGKDKTEINFLCITMIDPATSWLDIVELLISQPSELDIPVGTKGHKGKDKYYPTTTTAL